MENAQQPTQLPLIARDADGRHQRTDAIADKQQTLSTWHHQRRLAASTTWMSPVPRIAAIASHFTVGESVAISEVLTVYQSIFFSFCACRRITSAWSSMSCCRLIISAAF